MNGGSGGTLPVTGAGVLTVAGIKLSMAGLAWIGVGIVVVGALLMLVSLRWRWRRGRNYNQP